LESKLNQVRKRYGEKLENCLRSFLEIDEDDREDWLLLEERLISQDLPDDKEPI
jgi:hypothetical protein